MKAYVVKAKAKLGKLPSKEICRDLLYEDSLERKLDIIRANKSEIPNIYSKKDVEIFLSNSLYDDLNSFLKFLKGEEKNFFIKYISKFELQLIQLIVQAILNEHLKDSLDIIKREKFSQNINVSKDDDFQTFVEKSKPTRYYRTLYPFLNENMQKAINLSQDKVEINKQIFKVNDKVMQIRNNYNLIPENSTYETEGVYNGDIGFVREIDREYENLEVVFYDGSFVKYKKEDIKDLDLSYAITIHKSQGSEFDCVIIPMMQVAPMLLTRNLFYTGVTRAKKLVILVGDKKIIKKMVDNNSSNKRYTNLSYWINEMGDVIDD